jgi:ribosomal protein S26
MIVEKCDKCGQEIPKDLDFKDWTEYNIEVVREYINSQEHLKHLREKEKEES